MSPVRAAATPRRPLYRIGRLPDPLEWPAREFIGVGRFDDPKGEFRVLYAGDRRACFLETLAAFRPSLELIARLREVGAGEETPPVSVPADWYQKRAMGQLRLAPGQRWLDLRATETREALRVELAETLVHLGLKDLDLSSVVGPRRQLTQAIGRWAFEQRFSGIAYESRFDHSLRLWAIFEGTRFDRVDLAEPIVSDDPDLVAVAKLFGLQI